MPEVPHEPEWREPAWREPKWRRYLRFWRADVAADVDDELRFHFEARTGELRARGLPPAEAERVAREEFGDVDATRRELRAIGERLERRRARVRWWQHAAQDLRYVRRGLRATPVFTAGVLLTLAVSAGAAIVMHGTVRRLLLQPPPHVVEPGELGRPYFHYGMPGGHQTAFDRFSYPYFERARELLPAAGATMAAYEPRVTLLAGAGDASREVTATLVSAGFWRTLGARPLLGRFIADGEAHPATGARVVVLGHAYWKRHHGGDASVIGTTLDVRGAPYQVIGVAPRGFRGIELADTDLWLPLFAASDVAERPAGWHTRESAAGVKYVVRVAPGAAAAQAAATLTREHALLVRAAGEAQAVEAALGRPTTHVSLEGVTRAINSRGRPLPEARVTLWMAGVAALLLAIACANVASLLLLRALRRRREIAVRLALGMSRRRLAALLFTESAVLALAGGAGAGLLAMLGGEWVHRTLLPRMVGESAGVDWWAVAAAAGLVAAVALLIPAAPILQTRTDVAAGLAGTGPRGTHRRSRLHAGLLVAQTALSTVLLVGAGLFLSSLHRVTTTDLGLDTTHALVVRTDFSGSGRSPGEAAALMERAVERVRAMPGVRAASLASGAPLRDPLPMPIRTAPGGEVVHTASGIPMGNRVTEDFFESVGMRLVAGRGITAADRGGPPVAVVNEALARLAWPGRSPIGECAYVGPDGTTCARVVGVAGNARTFRVREEQQLSVFVPLADSASGAHALLVRVAEGANGIDAAVERLLRDMDPAILHVDAEWLGDALAPELRTWRLGAGAFTAFGALAALLAALGLYTAVAYAVSQRTREIGVRVAVGASRASVVRLVLGDGIRVATVGVFVGILLALAGGRWVAEMLFETEPGEPLVLLAVAGGLVVVGALASLAPARRAARVQPTEALRVD